MRGKRVGSAQSARRIQPGGSGSAVPVWSDPLVGPTPGRARPPPGAFPPSVVRRDRLWVGLEGLGAKVATGFGRELYSAHCSVLAASRGRGLSTRCVMPPSGGARGPLPPARLSTGSDCPQCAPNRVASPGRGPAHVNWRKGSAAMSATHPTRLETRTKESNARASQRVFSEHTPWRNESEGRRAPAEVGSRPLGAGRTTGPSRPLCRGGGA